MPGFDRTGPLGEGPMTGRGLGYCGGRVGWPRFGGGRGFGGGWGRGFGWRNRFNAPTWTGRGYGVGWRYGYAPGLTSREEIDLLNAEAKDLERDLEDIRRRVDDLKKTPPDQESPKE